LRNALDKRHVHRAERRRESMVLRLLHFRGKM
jgi:hypothetical protein